MRPNNTTTVSLTAGEAGVEGAFGQILSTGNTAGPADLTYSMDNYTSTTESKMISVYGRNKPSSAFAGGGFWDATTAITSFNVALGTGNFTAGNILIYGVS